MATTTFGRPTDLLASTSAQTDSTLLSESRVFEPNGLLSPNAALGNSPQKDIEPQFEDSSPHVSSSKFASGRTFEPTGLLDGLTNSSSQDDDDLPVVSEAFGLPRLLQSESTSSSTSYHPAGSSASTSRFNIRATTFEGKPFFIRKKPKLSSTTRRQANNVRAEHISSLLDIPIHRMLDRISAEKARKLSRSFEPQSSSKESTDDTLWVDRYRPRRFVELMGNERVARETMAWVKQWDWCVFGKNKGKAKQRASAEDGYEDDYHRPREKILLLSGPPGLGKTTLAHVVAKQAGYEVVEINASDARSAQVIDDRIRPTLEAGSTVGSTKPVLLIIDEIDGATGSGESSNTFIHKLVQLTYDRPKKKGRGQKDQGGKRPLLRPIICICNDINAAALAKLRPVACQMRMQRPADVHTVKRLREVCQIEGLKADSRALSALVGISKSDLRGCLNTLQFIKSKNMEVTEHIIRQATRGMKETDASLSGVLTDLFTPLAKKRAHELGLNEEGQSRYVSRLSHEVESCGRDSAVATGCFTHYATLRHHDADFSRYEKAGSWLTTFDMFSTAMYVDGDFALNVYLPYMLVPFYPLFSERGAPRIERDATDWDYTQVTRMNEEIYKTLGRCLHSASARRGGDYRHLVCSPVLQLEFAPYLNRIISPPLKPVNSQIINPEDKAVLARLAKLMASLELRFVQERGEDGQLTYRLDPAIDVCVTYDGKRAADIPVSRYAVRHLVAAEVDVELTRRQTDAVEKIGAKKGAARFRTDTTPTKRPIEDTEDPPQPNKKARIGNAADVVEKPPTDFFGRPIVEKTASKPSSKAGGVLWKKTAAKVFRVSYKFVEGNSAAVRKPVKMSAFL